MADTKTNETRNREVNSLYFAEIHRMAKAKKRKEILLVARFLTEGILNSIRIHRLMETMTFSLYFLKSFTTTI
jgi:hypothetical protein